MLFQGLTVQADPCEVLSGAVDYVVTGLYQPGQNWAVDLHKNDHAQTCGSNMEVLDPSVCRTHHILFATHTVPS